MLDVFFFCTADGEVTISANTSSPLKRNRDDSATATTFFDSNEESLSVPSSSAIESLTYISSEKKEATDAVAPFPPSPPPSFSPPSDRSFSENWPLTVPTAGKSPVEV